MKPIAILTAVLPLLTAGPARAAEVTLERVPENGVQPQVAVGPDGTVHLVYLTGPASESDVRYTARGASAAAWSEPVTVNSRPRSAMALGTIRGAQLAVGKNGRVHVVWNGRGESKQPEGEPLFYARLEGGKFTAQEVMNAGTIHLDGGASIAADDRGGVSVVWHAAPPGGKSEAERRVYLRRSTDDGATFSAAAPAAGAAAGVCPCCSLKAAALPDGSVMTLYRNAAAKDSRDMTVLITPAAGEGKARQLDHWAIPACPMSSAALIRDGKTMRAAWENAGVIYTSLVPDAGARPVALSGAGARHPSLAVNTAGETLVAWSTGTGWQRGGDVAWCLLDKSGKPGPAKGSAPGVPVWSHTAVYTTAAGNFVILH